jgi:hypothetical protein
MEKQDVPNARDEIRKLQEALKGKAKIPAPPMGLWQKGRELP